MTERRNREHEENKKKTTTNTQGGEGYNNLQAGPALLRLPVFSCVSETTGWGSVTHAALRLTAETHLTPFFNISRGAAALATSHRQCDSLTDGGAGVAAKQWPRVSLAAGN